MNKTTLLGPLHIRVLFPHLLTLSKTDPRRLGAPKSITQSKAVDLELYTYFALLLRDFIHPWYRMLTTDQDLTEEILTILTWIIQNLEKRLCEEVDWTELILLDLPKLFTMHYHDYRQAKRRLHMDHGSGCHSLVDLFHGMQPHYALQPIENREKEYLSMLTESLLRILLRPEDYQSGCLLSSYETRLDELEASGKFSETYFSALTNSNLSKTQEQTEQETLTQQMQRLQAQRNQEEEESFEDLKQPLPQETKRKRFSFGYITLQVVLAPFYTLWLHLMATMTQSQERYHRVNQHKKRTRQVRLIEPLMDLAYVACRVEERPVLQWAWQMVGMFFWPLIRVFGGGLLVDKFLEQTVLHMLSEDHIVFYLRMGSDLLWPEGVFIQKADPPTPLQREQMRVRAERLLTVVIPGRNGLMNVLILIL
ncbi:PXA domain-containing protein [Gilbertella persicaria]|uniref:PXA domain-containing protein n=1 Tax=Gilbertella persicaria TaxID=101096 RepID=UPI00221F1AFB|nr:PXA domain-containing protein [Gilbertella persicaria]KAI8091203.1 PXA domain-containing protein [Gilbertella persicaria]